MSKSGNNPLILPPQEKAPVPLTSLKGVGQKLAEKLARLNLETVSDLLFLLPLRYQDRTTVTPIAQLCEGREALIEGRIESAEIKFGRKRMLLCMVHDGSAPLMLRFFHFGSAQQQQFQIGVNVRCFGEVRQGFDCLELVHPEYRFIHPDETYQAEEVLTPVYPSTEGLYQNQLRKLTDQVLQHELPDYLPADLCRQFNLPGLADSLQTVHRPPPQTDTYAMLEGNHPAQRRLAFEELLAHHLSLRTVRAKAVEYSAPALDSGNALTEQLLADLPFQLTGAQQHAWEEIRNDLSKTSPMQRLLQGDVGAGKTVVAALAALQAIAADYQVAIMAPTELLAEQHRRTFTAWLAGLGIEPTWLSGSLSKKQRAPVLENIALGLSKLVVGTHALFQDDVQFAKLGLVIVDEQHRFGVHQRLSLRDKGGTGNHRPHQLIMTATPIPRTLALTAYADLDVSIIDELPPGRTPVTTAVIPDQRRAEIIARVAAVCGQKHQAYWVCPLIEESEALQCQAAEDTAALLAEELPELCVALVHGRMKSKEKDAVMAEFKAGNIDLLVATTVIEVGVDVPNAILMIIENAERMGLAQLHQLRGRVGRGAKQSFCVLLYKAPLSLNGKSRLGTLRETQDGFVIAQRDLELRGPGEILGTRQTGLARLRIADLQRDQDMLDDVAAAADMLLQQAPQNIPALLQRWLRKGIEYGEVY